MPDKPEATSPGETTEKMKIHPTATVDSGAEIGRNVEIGPQAYIGPNVVVGDDCIIGHGCHLAGHTTLGRNNHLGPHVVLGTAPQDLKYHGQKTELVVGDDNVFREFVTVHIGTVTGHSVTRIGNRNYFMICSHVGHDCIIEHDCILVNNVLLGGHCHIETGAKLMGGTALNPFVSVGKQSFVGGLTRVVHDVPPFLIVEGNPARVRGVNEIGLQRAGYDQEVIQELWEAYKKIYRAKQLNRARIFEQIEEEPDICPEVIYLTEFLRRSQKGPHGRFQESQR
jgi:UDP-N-acetylglucosamine acyltransferase